MNTDTCKDFHKALAIIDETHSGRIVICATVTFKLHKLILNLHSPVFAKTLSTRWEASNPNPGLIELDDEDPGSLRAMFDFFYKFEYDVPKTCTSEQAIHVRLFKMADKFEFFSLGNYAHSRLTEMQSTAAWGIEDFIEVAKLLHAMQSVPCAGRLKDLAVSVLKRKIEDLADDIEWLDFITDHPDWISDVISTFDDRGQGDW